MMMMVMMLMVPLTSASRVMSADRGLAEGKLQCHVAASTANCISGGRAD